MNRKKKKQYIYFIVSRRKKSSNQSYFSEIFRIFTKIKIFQRIVFTLNVTEKYRIIKLNKFIYSAKFAL